MPPKVLALSLMFATAATVVVGSPWIQQPAPAAQVIQSQQDTSLYQVLVKGIAASRPFRVQFKSAPLRLEFRNLVMGRGNSDSIPVPTRILMELRLGGVTTVINGERRERRQGEFWVVEKGSSLRFQAPGEVATIRAIYIFEGER
jgi:hypothetical protein